jgi:hypothetical protein
MSTVFLSSGGDIFGRVNVTLVLSCTKMSEMGNKKLAFFPRPHQPSQRPPVDCNEGSRVRRPQNLFWKAQIIGAEGARSARLALKSWSRTVREARSYTN